MTEFLTGITALAAVAATIAAWRSARASEKGSELAQRAALLGSIPILVPWVEAEAAKLRVVNRGTSDAHETRWFLIAGETPLASGTDARVIPPGKARDLTDPQDGVIAKLLRADGFVARCEFTTSWGEALTVDRIYRDGRSAGIELRSSDGEVLRITN